MEPPHHQADDGVRSASDPRTRALLLWPGLDRLKLARTRGQPGRVARLVGRRTALPRETILGMLGCDPDACDGERGRRSAPPLRTCGLAASGAPQEARGGRPRPPRLIEAGTNAHQLGRAS